MGLRSMTGYGSAHLEGEGWQIEVECKSFNRKRLDTRVNAPDDLSGLEAPIRQRVKARCNRGRVEVSIDVDVLPGGGADIGGLLDSERFNAVRKQLHELSKRSATGPVELSDILQFKDFFVREQPLEAEDHAEAILETVEEALDGLVDARTREGRGIAEDLVDYIGQLDETLDTYRDRAPAQLETLRERVRERVNEAMDEFEGGEPDEQRLAEEIVYHVDRADVSEELQRAGAHVESLRELIDSSPLEEAVGKKVDFYLQELVRETNTLASKSHSSELTDLAVAMKSTVEKMREQAANVE